MKDDLPTPVMCVKTRTLSIDMHVILIYTYVEVFHKQ